MRKIINMLLSAVLMMLLLHNCKTVQPVGVSFKEDRAGSKIEVFVGEHYFTSLIYTDSLEKPILFPILTASGKTVTRGYPIDPRPHERIDHPHQMGLWLNFGDVNGLDFWNNSSAISPDRKSHYGHIQLDSIIDLDPDAGELITLSTWKDYQKNRLLEERTTYRFSGDTEQNRFIERTSHLTALQQVTLRSNKEGLFAIRVDRAFEEPDEKPVKRLDAGALPADVPYAHNEGVNGQYRNQQGYKTESEVWGIKTPWVALRAEKEGEVITLVILDHPQNPGYPGWPHARGYGLFSMNNLAGNTMNPADPPIEIVLNPGEEISFRHLLIIGGEITDEMINGIMKQFHNQ